MINAFVRYQLIKGAIWDSSDKGISMWVSVGNVEKCLLK